MYRIVGILAVLLQISSSAYAQYDLDTLSHRPVGPGMIHTHVLEASEPWNIHIFTADLTNPYLNIETVKANDRLRGLERTSLMAARRDSAGHRIVGGVNGDFYAGGGEPISIQVAQGTVVRREVEGRPAVGFNPDNNPMMGFVEFSGVIATGDTTLRIDGVNESRGSDQIILYNSYIGASTGTNQYGTEIALELLAPRLVNDSIRVVVLDERTGIGDMAVPSGGVVLSGHGIGSDALRDAVEAGDTLTLLTSVQPAPGKIKEMVSGGPLLVVDGQIDVGPRGDGAVRHPRTAVGFNADSTKLILATVDGRQSISAGMTLHELATLMWQAGAAYAMNLDGGGSTTMLVRGDVANSPSDTGGERTVSNSLLLFSTAPIGSLDQIRLSNQMVRLFRGTSYQVEVEGIDEYYNPLPLDSALLSFEADPEIGSIDENGLLQAAMSADTGYVRVSYAEHTDSVRVIIKDIGRLAIGPASILTDTLETVEFSVEAFDTDNVRQGVPEDDFSWMSTNPVVGSVDAHGVFNGHAAGETSVIVSYGPLSDTAYVTVAVYEGFSLLDSLETTIGWNVTGEQIDLEASSLSATDSVATLGAHSFKLDYEFVPSQETSRIFVNRSLDVAGLPDSIFVDVLSTESGHRIYFEAVDSKNDSFTFYPPGRRPDLPTDEMATIAAPFKASEMLHPIRFARIGVQLAAATGSEPRTGTIHFDNLRVSYPGHTTTSIERETVPSSAVLFHPNYPNPFSRRTTLSYDLAEAGLVRLEVYDLLGRSIRVIEDGPRAAGSHEVLFDAGDLPSGLYFVRLKAGRVTKSRAISILR